MSTSWPLLSIDSVILVNNNLQIQYFFLIPVVALDHYADWPIRIDIINHFIVFDTLTSRVVYSKPPKINMSPRFRDHFNPGNFIFQPSKYQGILQRLSVRSARPNENPGNAQEGLQQEFPSGLPQPVSARHEIMAIQGSS